jgi:hypothetical protein
MNTRHLQHAVRGYLATADAHNIELPADIRADVEQALTVIDTISAPLDGPSFEDALTTALLNGTDPFTDPAVIGGLVSRELHSTGTQTRVIEKASARLWQIVVTNADALIAPFQPPFNAAGEAFTTAHAKLTAAGITGLDDDTIKRSPLTVAKANLDARAALEALRTIENATASILLATDRLPSSPISKLNRLADTGDALADELRALGKSPSYWEIVNAGHTISLATRTEAEQRRAHAYEEQDRAGVESRRDYAQEARANAMQKMLSRA